MSDSFNLCGDIPRSVVSILSVNFGNNYFIMFSDIWHGVFMDSINLMYGNGIQ